MPRNGRPATIVAIMVDRMLRDRFAGALRQLLSRQITNWEFEDFTRGEDLQSADRVLGPIYWRAWTLYSDGMWPERVSQSTAREMRLDVARWVLFLQADLEYRWPPGPMDTFAIRNWPMNLLTFGWWERRKERELRAWQRHGNFDVWPFWSRAEFDAARRAPRFLVGV